MYTLDKKTYTKSIKELIHPGQHRDLLPDSLFNAIVKIEIEQDEPVTIGRDFDFGSEKANQAYLRQFERGELINCLIIVTVSCQSVQSREVLGGCHLKASNLMNEAMEVIEDHNMEKHAINSVIRNMHNLYEALRQTLNK